MKTETYEVVVITCDNGTRLEKWLQNSRLHRLDGPAYTHIYADGDCYEHWFQNGKRHRLDGPALIVNYAHGGYSESWWKNGVQVAAPKEEEDPCAGRVVNIDGREYRLEPVTGE